jgi:hypothetical protein
MNLRAARRVAVESHLSSVAKDDRGAIMVVGVFFTFLWIGLVWFILGIGTAIDYHENLQTAADAAAFAAAVYDARGMNILAMINVIMGVALSALVIAHIVQAVSFVALFADCTRCIPDKDCGYGWADCPGDCSNMSSVNDAVKDVDTAVHTILEVSHGVEMGIAIGWPWVAAGKSTTLVPATEWVPLTTSFSYSQVPSGGDLAADMPKIALKLVGLVDKNPQRFGLPVMSDSYVDLCKVATLDVTALYGVIPGVVSGVLGDAVNELGNWICDAGGDSHDPTHLIEHVVSQPFASECMVYGGGDLGLDALPGDMEDVSGKNHFQSPMKMINTKMGTDYFGVWSTAIGNYSDGVTPLRVAIAGLESKSGNKVVAPLPDDAFVGVARAEFYYDPKVFPADTVTAETKIDNNDGIPIPNVMWNMRWRARLRRYHNFPGRGGSAASLEAALNSLSGGLAEDALKKVMGGVGGVFGLDISDNDVDSESNPPAKGIYH